MKKSSSYALRDEGECPYRKAQKTWRLFLNVHYCATDAAVKTKKLYRVVTLIMYAFIC